MDTIRKIVVFILKDFKNEFRTKELFSSMFTFSLLVIVIFNFSFSFSKELLNKAVPSFLWISFIFAGVLGLSRSFSIEKENDAIKGTILTPTSSMVLYFSKFLSNLVFLLLMEALIVPLFIIFFNYNMSASVTDLAFIIIAGTAGFVSVGTLFSAMSINTRLREVILPILLFPIILPLIINSIRATQAVLNGESLGKVWYSIELILAFDLIFILVSSLVYEYVTEED